MLFIKHRLRFLEPIAYKIKSVWRWSDKRLRFSILFITAAILVSNIATALNPLLVQHAYALGSAEKLLMDKDSTLAEELKFDTQQQMFTFSTDPTTSSTSQNVMAGVGGGTQSSGLSATAYPDATKGVSVTDNTNKVSFKMTPQFKLATGQKDSNRLVYPLVDSDGWLVYTMTDAGPKEDVVLQSSRKSDMALDYKMELGDKLEARLESNGSVGIYGNSLFSGDIATGSASDAALVTKARKNATKNKLIFAIPAPTIKETIKSGNVQAHYTVDKDMLTMHVQGLKAGNYPITIDPSIYVVTAYQFMYGNNETNTNFDVTNKLIKKGRTTGARFDSWQNTQNLPIGSWGSGSVASGGYIYQVGGSSFSGTVVSTPGASTYLVPGTVTSIGVQMWGGGGGGGAAAGGGGGYVEATVPVTPGETLNLFVGGGGGASGNVNVGGGGGALSSLYHATTPTVPVMVAGGGGGGGSNSTAPIGGLGGGATASSGVANGTAGTAGPSSLAGGGGTTAGGAGGASATCPGAAGTSLAGGAGAQDFIGNCTTGGGGAAGTNSGGTGGFNGSTFIVFGTATFGGGGGGGGYFGGGGGAGTTGSGAGGGGGSTYYNAALSSAQSVSIGSGTAPGNNTDPYRGNAGNGGAALAAGTAGLIVISTNAAGDPATRTLNFSQFDTGNGTVVNANPGNGTCSGWCTSQAYDMPGDRSNFSLVAYNGYLYAMGGNDKFGPAPATASSGHKYNTVYVTKLGANGEPRYWSPTSDDPTTWNVWYTSTHTLPNVRINGAAVAYNNKMYFVGGLDDTNNGSVHSGTAQSTVWVANILPNGDLGTWSTSTALTSGGPGALYGMTGLVYNDRIYITGGATAVGTAPLATVYYININSDGSLGSSWIQTNSFSGGRVNGGGSGAVVWGGYVYVSGGCGAVNSIGACTNVLGDTQIASINADGSLDTFTTVTGVTNVREGFGMLAWRDNIYEVGGCSAQNAGTGDCLSGIQSGINYGSIPHEGEVSTVSTSVASGTAPCTASATTWNSSCNLPGNRQYSMTAVVNNFLYVIGGCAAFDCGTSSTTVYMTTLQSNGTLQEYPPNNTTSTPFVACPGGWTNTSGWCSPSSTALGALPGSGLGAAGIAVYNGTIYLIGGLTGSATLSPNIYRSTVSTNGTIGTWSTAQGFSGVGLSASPVSNGLAYLYAFARANPSANGTAPANLYLMGGCVTSFANTGTTCTSGNIQNKTYKCDITPSSGIANCADTGQNLPTALGQMGGATYGNNIYLLGGTTTGADQKNTIYRATIDNSNNISSWTSDTKTLPTAVRSNSTYAYNGYLYSIGGLNGTALQTTINDAKINTDDGSIDSTGWDTSAVAISARLGATPAVASGYTYLIGGCATFTTACSLSSATIQSFRLYNNVSGSPTSWVGSSSSMGNSRFYHGAVALNGFLYVAGGCTSASVSTNNCAASSSSVEMAKINNDGSLSGVTAGTAWCTSAGGTGCPAIADLPSGATGGGGLVTVGGSLYFIGGAAGSGGAIQQAVFYATPNASTGATGSWGTVSTGNNLPAPRAFSGITVWNNRIYVAGGLGSGTGCDANAVCSNIFISPTLGSGGNITSAWTTSATSLPVNRYALSLIAYANNLYVIGGSNNAFSNPLSDVSYIPIDVSGSANSSSGDSLGSLSYSTSLPHGMAYISAFAVNGYLYVMGGMKDSTTISTCNSTTLVAPISSNTSSGTPTGVGNWGEPGPWAATAGTSGGTFTGGWGMAATYYNGKVYQTGGVCNNSVIGANTTVLAAASGVGNKNVQQATLLTQPQVAKYSISFDTDTDVYPDKYLVNGNSTSNGGARWQFKYQSMTNPLVNNAGNGLGKDCSTALMSDWGKTTTVNPLVLSALGSYAPLDSSGANTNCARYYYMSFSVDSSQAYGFPEDFTRVPTITDITLRYSAQPQKRLLHGRTFVNEAQSPDDTPVYSN